MDIYHSYFLPPIGKKCTWSLFILDQRLSIRYMNHYVLFAPNKTSRRTNLSGFLWTIIILNYQTKLYMPEKYHIWWIMNIKIYWLGL